MRSIVLASLFLFFFFILGDGETATVSADGTTRTQSNPFYDCMHSTLQQDNFRQPGQHLVCAVLDPTRPGGVLINVIVDSLSENSSTIQKSPSVTLQFDKDNGDIEELFSFLYDKIGTSNNRRIQKWKMYTMSGDLLNSIDNLIYHTDGIIYTNGNFIWPGVRVGYKRKSAEGYEIETLSLKPLVLRVVNFLTFEECDYIRQESEPHMAASGTSKMDHDHDKPDTTWRTSTQYFLSSENKPIIQAIDQRTAQLTKTKTNQQEFVQVLRYMEGQKYDQHHDYFDVRFYQKDPVTLRSIKNGEKNRLATVLWYLTTVADGGHTIFPLANGNVMGRNHDFEDCNIPNALLVKPVRGEVIIFYSLSADGGLDDTSLHGACKVGPGLDQKWAANKWIWTENAGFLS